MHELESYQKEETDEHFQEDIQHPPGPGSWMSTDTLAAIFPRPQAIINLMSPIMQFSPKQTFTSVLTRAGKPN